MTRLGEVARQQAGVVSRAQALEVGLTPGAIRAHLRAGRWSAVYQGIYRTFTGAVPRRARLWAVLLRAGPTAVLSHQTAAELSGLLAEPCDPVHVTIPLSRRVRVIPGAVLHRSARLEHARQPGPDLRRTRVEETVIDLAISARKHEVAIGWITRACGRRLTTPDRIRAAITRRPRVRWRRLLLAVVDDTADGCHSVLERRFLRDVEHDHRLPRGRRQKVPPQKSGRRRYRDVAYDDFGTVVELDGRAYHPEERRSEDRQRDNEAAAAAIRTLRYGWSDVATPCAVAVQVVRALRSGGWRGRPRRCRRVECVVRP
ncbi:type IV toxin-antitoxin system AbiEi family antitoxin domain-containing protein [Dactylosporangium roseum]|uniref:Type IV toxin-antitoxin system AbiEi family antitoxin domain-containing protein n=1 Tax=Dactylosporangium roseum TaxID=47989 RepID=A0ABY5Z8U9_9ACTN|nr:type IV toxin-antitoxin system AbiEi family antitoxin domain-containing protein [Dactylosporangium roseum]UWZ38510.1 type IV toxin-antitoxin system AbiEi family antitoxin domain-containing protein [Dactylosporangium roseum]